MRHCFQVKKVALQHLLLLLMLPFAVLGQNQSVNGNMNVSGITYSSNGIGLGTGSNVNTYSGRKLWTERGDFNYMEYAQGNWGGTSAFIFNGYSTTNEGAIDGAGNIKHSNNAGAFSSGAGMIKYMGNYGVFHFAMSNASTGVGTSVVWKSLMSLNRDQSAVFYGNVGIGTTTPNAKLAVNGNIRAKEVKVEAAPWPDYVFEEDYQLPDLSELSSYIKQHKHLPGMPSAKEVEAEGVNLGEMNRLLLEKVEELTMLLIEKDKNDQATKAELKEMRTLIERLMKK